MAQAIFWFGVINVFMMVGFPLTDETRLKAVFGWLGGLCGASLCQILLSEQFPSFDEPAWTRSLWWWAVSWIVCITGFIVAIRKPRKRDHANVA